MTKPEPLTKEKMKTIRVIEWLESCSFGYKRKRQNFRMYKDLVTDLPEAIFIEDLQELINKLLKEIEKEKKKIENNLSKFIYECSDEDYLKGVRNGYIVSIELIKKAFEGVRE